MLQLLRQVGAQINLTKGGKNHQKTKPKERDGNQRCYQGVSKNISASYVLICNAIFPDVGTSNQSSVECASVNAGSQNGDFGWEKCVVERPTSFPPVA